MIHINILKQSVVFIFALFFMSMGVTLSVKADLGVSPISCIPYVYSLKFPLTLGETTIILNVLLILLQMAVLRKKYEWVQLIQIPVVFVFGFFIDFTMQMFSWLEPADYLSKALLCLLACVVVAFGVFLEVKAKLTYLPGEGLAMAITKVFDIEFGKTKIAIDSSMVILGIASSFIFLSALAGIREGTVAAAILVGYFARFYGKHIHILDKWLATDEKLKMSDDIQSAASTLGNNLVITIAREYGSGGHQIGKAVADKLGITFYDKELIQMTAAKSGFTTDYIQKHEQKLVHNLLYQLYEQNYAYIDEKLPPLNALFLVQSKIIRDIYAEGSAVIVGRCSNFILKDQPGCFNIFIHADSKTREKRVQTEYGVPAEKAAEEIEEIDIERANYCKQFTGKVWDDVRNYHLTIDSSELGVEKSAQLIVDTVKEYVEREGV